MKETFKPMGDRVVVRRSHIPVPGDLVVPDKYKDEPDRGHVVAVGPGRNGVPMTLKVGDKVLLDRTAAVGQFTRINGEDVLILYEAEIAGTLE
jgi:chaperonin GroES